MGVLELRSCAISHTPPPPSLCASNSNPTVWNPNCPFTWPILPPLRILGVARIPCPFVLHSTLIFHLLHDGWTLWERDEHNHVCIYLKRISVFLKLKLSSIHTGGTSEKESSFFQRKKYSPCCQLMKLCVFVVWYNNRIQSKFLHWGDELGLVSDHRFYSNWTEVEKGQVELSSRNWCTQNQKNNKKLWWQASIIAHALTSPPWLTSIWGASFLELRINGSDFSRVC